MSYADIRFMVTLGSYSVKPGYFNTIFDLLRLRWCTGKIIVGFTTQLLSIVTRKRGGKRRAKDHRTGITLRLEETSTLRATLRVTLFPKN